jgi:hypothetical protein
MIEHAAEHGLTADIFWVGRFFRVFVPERDEVVDSLMRPLPVVMGMNFTRACVSVTKLSIVKLLVNVLPGLLFKRFQHGKVD